MLKPSFLNKAYIELWMHNNSKMFNTNVKVVFKLQSGKMKS